MTNTGTDRAVIYRTQKKNQYKAAVTAALGALIVGTLLGWTSPANPQLATASKFVTPNNETIILNALGKAVSFTMTTTEMSIMSSILAVGAAFAALPMGIVAQKIGRHRAIMFLNMPFLISWVLTIFAVNAYMLIIARFIGGIGMGGICSVVPVYIAEIAETSIRGFLGGLFQLFITLGILFTYIVGGLTSWKLLSVVCGTLVPIKMVFFWFMPETPSHLLGKRRQVDAVNSLKWLRGPEANLDAELNEIQTDIDEAAKRKGTLKGLWSNIACRRALTCSLGLMFFQQFSGINAVVFYTHEIFIAAGSSINSSIATIIIGAVMSLATVISTVLVDRAGRKSLLVQSGAVMGISLLILGIYFVKRPRSLGFIPLISLILFVIFFSLGFGPIPWVMMAELFPIEFKPVATGVTAVTNLLLVFIVTLLFPIMKDLVGIHVCFWFFALIMLLSVLFVKILVPETKGKSLAEIQKMLGSKT